MQVTAPSIATGLWQPSKPTPATLATGDPPLSSNAGAGGSTSKQDFAALGAQMRARLDAIYAEGAKSGTRIVYDSANGGKFPDLSDFSDQDVAAIALNRSGGFSSDERHFAEGTLNQRLSVALEPFATATMSGDRRGQATAINLLYANMSQEVRDAMHWTPVMMQANNSMLDGDTTLLGRIDTAWVRRTLRGTRATGHPLDTSFLDAATPLTYSPPSVYTPPTGP